VRVLRNRRSRARSLQTFSVKVPKFFRAIALGNFVTYVGFLLLMLFA